MTDPSPYAPPAARVDDPSRERGPVPTSLRRAGQLLWASVGLSFVLVALYLVGAVESASLATEVVATVVSASLLGLFAWKVGAGRNWARWLFAAMFVFGTLMFVVMLIAMPQAFLGLSVLQQISALSQLGLQTAALVLMFVRASRQWFTAG